MTDHDQHLQDAFDRSLRGDGPPPEVDDDSEAAAYQQVYAVLGEEPAGDLPENFAEQVADRVGIGTVSSIAWGEIILLFALVAGVGASLVMLPSLAGPLVEGLRDGVRILQTLSTDVRLDVLGAAGLVLLLTLLADALWRRWPRLRRVSTTS
jgi:hypothetical protein